MRGDDEAGRPDDDGRAVPSGPRPATPASTGDAAPSLTFAQTYRSPRPRLTTARNAVIAASTACGLIAAANVWAWFALRSAAADSKDGRGAVIADLRQAGETAVADRVQDVQNLNDALLAVFGLTVIVAIVTVLRWQNEAVRQQWALGLDRPRFTPRRAGWSWFVPIWFLFGPKQAYNDLWRASEPGAPTRVADASWRDRTPGRLLTAWWAAWLVANFATIPFDGGFRVPTTIGETMTAALGSTVSFTVFVVAGVLFLRVLATLTDRFDRRAAELRAAPGAP